LPSAVVLFAPSPPPVGAAGTFIPLEDSAWEGGYRQASGSGGRTTTWIYGTGTQYHTMQATFQLAAQPQGTVSLRIAGMDAEDVAKTPIRITVNNSIIYDGPNPLPNEELPQATYTWRFAATLLKPDTNMIRISNQASGQISHPPFFMLDYASLRFDW
jgi:hypothetical protein